MVIIFSLILYNSLMRFFFLLGFLSVSVLSFSQNLNNIGFDLGGYIVGAPKHKLTGDKYNPYMENKSGAFGIFYERYIGDYPYSIKTGFYYNYQFNCVRSIHIPIEFNGNLLGKRNESFAFLGYTGGFSYNKLIDIVSSITYFVEPGTNADVSIKKTSYLAPHLGLNAGINVNKFCFSGSLLYHFLIPEYMNFNTSYNNNKTIEQNTNSSYGISLRLGVSYRF